MSVRILLGVTVAALTGGAHASSLVFPEASSSTPSIVTLSAAGEIKARDVVAVGEPGVTYEKVAAVPTTPVRHVFMPSPVIIRGGVVGGNTAVPSQGTAPVATPPATASAGSPPPEAQQNPTEPASPQEPAAAQPARGPARTK